jgi:hypothetical protein
MQHSTTGNCKHHDTLTTAQRTKHKAQSTTLTGSQRTTQAVPLRREVKRGTLSCYLVSAPPSAQVVVTVVDTNIFLVNNYIRVVHLSPPLQPYHTSTHVRFI